MINFIEKIKKIKTLFFPYFKIFVDLGTSLTKIAIENKGIILRQPTYLAYDTKKEQTIFIGDEAKNIVGKTPEFIRIIRPIVAGVISDFDSEVSLLKNFLQNSVELYTRYRFLKPIIEAVTTVPTIATEIEQKAVKEALNKTEISQTYIIEKALATASGCGLNIFSSSPNLIIEIGGGLTEISIIGSGNIIKQKTLKLAGDHFNKVIANYLYLKHAIILGENTCEELKVNLLSLKHSEKIETVRGKSLETGLPKSIRIKSAEIRESILPFFNQIVDLTKELIEGSPPEILDEILQKGIIITGGSAKIEGIDDFFAKELNLEVYIAPNPQDSTINGLIELSKKDKKLFKNLLISI